MTFHGGQIFILGQYSYHSEWMVHTNSSSPKMVSRFHKQNSTFVDNRALGFVILNPSDCASGEPLGPPVEDVVVFF